MDYRRRRWSQLEYDILDLVLQRLLLLRDCFSFGKVCTSWRSVFLDRCRITRPPPCMMAIPKRGPPLLFGLHEDKLLPLCSPKPDVRSNETVVGSSHGWLVTASVGKSSINLLNLTSNQRIPLPSTISGGIQMTPTRYRPTYFKINHLILSMVQTSGDCILVVDGGVNQKFTGRREEFSSVIPWCRPNDQEWRTFTLPPGFYVSTMIFYKDELYILCPDGDVLIYSFDPQPKLIERGLRSVANITGNYLGNGRLVESSGELLLIEESWAKNKNGFVIKVFKRAVETDEGWKKMESLGDRMLLIGWNAYACLNTQGLMGSSFVANSIYVADTFSNWRRFCLKDESSQAISPPCNSDRCQIEWIAAKAW